VLIVCVCLCQRVSVGGGKALFLCYWQSYHSCVIPLIWQHMTRKTPRHGMNAGSAPEKLSPRTRKFQKDPCRAFRYLHADRDDKARPIFMRLYNNEELADQICALGPHYANPALPDVTDSDLTPPSSDESEDEGEDEDEGEENSSNGGNSETSSAKDQNGSGAEAAGGTEQPANQQQQQFAPFGEQLEEEILDFEPSEQAPAPSAGPSGPPPPPPEPSAIEASPSEQPGQLVKASATKLPAPAVAAHSVASSGSKGTALRPVQRSKPVQPVASPPSRVPKLMLAGSQSPGARSLTRQQLSAAAAAVAAARPRDQLRSSQGPPASIQLPAADLRHVIQGTARQSALSGRSGAQLTAEELKDLQAVSDRLRSVKDLGTGSLDARLQRLIESRERFAEEMARYRRFFEAADKARDAFLGHKPEQRRRSRSRDREQMSPQQRRRSRSRDRVRRSPPQSRKRSRSRDRQKSPLQRQHTGRR